jgi:outer membrane protein assembly factor BamA
LEAGEANFVPPEQRVYAGGANDVRGFDRNELGPLVYVTPESNIGSQGEVLSDDSVQVAPIGGNTLAIGNLELRLPSPIFARRLGWVVFADAGAVWERGSGFSTLPNFALTPGIGFRFNTLVGPFRVDLAYIGADRPRGALYAAGPTSLSLIRTDYRKPRDRSFNLQISIGQAF